MEQVRRLNWYAGNKAVLEAIRVLQEKSLLRRTIDMEEVQVQNADYGRPLPACRYVDCPVTVGRAEDVYFATVETNTTDALSSWLKLDARERYGSWQSVWDGMTKSRRVAALNPKIGLKPSGTCDVTDFATYPLSEKERVVVDICVKAKKRQEQVVVATLFVDCNVRLVATLQRFGITAERFDGKLGQKARQEGLERFQSGGSDVMCMLMFAGGRGLNLQNANHLVLTSPWWNPVVLDQTRRRVWRVGSRHREVTMYNVFYDISVEQWMLQTRVKSKVLLAASLMNEEGIYGGEEAITTARSKKELSQTLQQTKMDEMWDFLSFLRAAPTARSEIRGVENIPWTEDMMDHPLVGPRCRRMMTTLFLSVKRCVKDKRLPADLPVYLWKLVFSFLFGQDFAPVPQQNIKSELKAEDKEAMARQEAQHQLEEVVKHLDECESIITTLRRRRLSLGGHAASGEHQIEQQVLAKQIQLQQVRSVLETTLYGVRKVVPPSVHIPATVTVHALADGTGATTSVSTSPRGPLPLKFETARNYNARVGGYAKMTPMQRDAYAGLCKQEGKPVVPPIPRAQSTPYIPGPIAQPSVVPHEGNGMMGAADDADGNERFIDDDPMFYDSESGEMLEDEDDDGLE